MMDEYAYPNEYREKTHQGSMSKVCMPYLDIGQRTDEARDAERDAYLRMHLEGRYVILGWKGGKDACPSTHPEARGSARILEVEGRDACPSTHLEGRPYGIAEGGMHARARIRRDRRTDSQERDACSSTHPEGRTYRIGMHARARIRRQGWEGGSVQT
jgi:hypothetical protein